MLVLFNKPFDVLCQFTDRSATPRRTLAEFGLPTLRLVRTRIGGHALGDLAPGAWRIIDAPLARSSRRATR